MKAVIKKIILSVIAVFLIFSVITVLAVAINTRNIDLSSTKYVAHRGYSGLYPQNTIPAFEKAVEAGFWGVECDIHTTKDGEWVVIHDDEISELTNGSGNIEDMMLDELMQYRMDSGNGIENYGTLPIPVLDEYLKICAEGNVVPVIEIKECDTKYLPSLKAAIEEYGLDKKVVIISFDEDYLTEYRVLDEDATIYYLKTNPSVDDVRFCIDNSFGLNANYGGMIKHLYTIIYAVAKKVPVAAWTVDSGFVADLMRILGAEVITSNVTLF